MLSIQINSFFGHPAFLRKFGTYNEATDRYYVPPNWQSTLNNAASIGQVSPTHPASSDCRLSDFL